MTRGKPGVHERLGIDIGRVITSGATDTASPTIFDAGYLDSLATPGAFETIRDLREKRFGDEIYLVSKCSPRIQARTLDWLRYTEFFQTTGVDPEKLHFCLSRPEKGVIAANLLLTHFIDDRPDVLEVMPPMVGQRILFIPEDVAQGEVPHYNRQTMVEARGWPAVRSLLLG
ncbi:MAG: hypothetical protein WBP26_05520 [Candidatus Saccharimonadales bacterium]